jgi:hypothetical protein
LSQVTRAGIGDSVKGHFPKTHDLTILGQFTNETILVFHCRFVRSERSIFLDVATPFVVLLQGNETRDTDSTVTMTLGAYSLTGLCVERLPARLNHK